MASSSFSDLMSSGRGPGVIGTLLALFVLLGFGLLFMLAGDDSSANGKSSLASIVKEQTNNLNALKSSFNEANAKLATGPKLIAASKEFSSARRKSQAQLERRAELEQATQLANSALAEKLQEVASYKDQYRALVRGLAKGKILSELKTTGGVVYKNAMIREVTAIGFQIRHDEGQKRIPYEELPADLIDFYQFDPAQKQALVVNEQSALAEHEAANQAAFVIEEKNAQAKQKADANAQYQKDCELLKQRVALLAKFNVDMAQIGAEVDRAASDANSARSSGKIHLNRSGNFAGKLSEKQNQILALQLEIDRLKAVVRVKPKP